MGYDIIAAFFMAALMPFVLLGFVVFWVLNARDHEALAACWRSYAKQRDLELIEPEGEWPNRTSPALAWRGANASYRICVVGREARVRTRLVIRPRSTLLGSVTVSIGDRGAGQDAPLREHPPGFSRRILGDQGHRLLLGLRQRDRVTLSYRRGRITVEWPGREQNEARLDEARRLGEALAQTIEGEFCGAATAALRQPAA